MTQPLLDEGLVKSITELHRATSAPFDLFVTETMRTMGFPVAEAPPADEVAAEVREITEQYFRAVGAAEPFFDILGSVYSEVSSVGRKQQAGQFFTPWALAVLSVEMTAADWTPRANPDSDDGLWGVYEPACGAGAMLLAFLHHIQQKHGPEALLLWSALAQDIDRTVARTCALQVMVTLARFGWGLGRIRIEQMDTLRMQRFEIVLSGEARRRHPLLIGEPLGSVAAAHTLVDRAFADAPPAPAADDRGQYLLLPPDADAEAA